jgi:hypothetical protein
MFFSWNLSQESNMPRVGLLEAEDPGDSGEGGGAVAILLGAAVELVDVGAVAGVAGAAALVEEDDGGTEGADEPLGSV